MRAGYGPFLARLLDKPDVTLMPFCAVCGRPARDKHHVVQKGMGGVSAEADSRIPLVRLCGQGNGSGCHGRLHQRVLHIYWEDGRDDEEPGYVFLFTREPMGDMECWERNRASYLPLPGWVEQRRVERIVAEQHVYGCGQAETEE